jgi:hypothetical protein
MAPRSRHVVLHWHNHTTRLLENVTVPRFFRELLGHGYPRTTDISLVTGNSLRHIKSPFDDL